MMAETYIPEGQEDSAFIFLDRAMESYKEKRSTIKEKIERSFYLAISCLLVICLLIYYGKKVKFNKQINIIHL